MGAISKRLDKFVERQGIVSAEFCKLIDRVEILESEVKYLREVKDHCEKCGCNEFLCGHNSRE